MKYPAFFDLVETITLQDDLADFLGASEDGIIEFSYLDIVKSAGHSCPTVASAYLMTKKGLDALFVDEIPIRGSIKVEFKEKAITGVSGVIGKVVSQITGATTNDGFKGIAGEFDRRNLLFFDVNINSNMRITRTDTNKSVDIFLNLSVAPGNPKQYNIMDKIISNIASDDEISEFKKLWQQRVKEILIDNFDNQEMIRINYN